MAVAAASVGCASGGGLRAQALPGDRDLDRIEAAVDSGRVAGAREALDRWIAESSGASPEAAGRARFLRARLEPDPEKARSEYMQIALDGRSSYGARAWLRLAQMDIALDEPERALAGLQRLRADYPGSPVDAESWFWTARAQEQRGDLDAACDAFTRAVVDGRARGESQVVERAAVASMECAPGGLRFSLQVGAFSGRAAARDLAATLGGAGFEARVVPDGGLHKVRVGWFSTPDTARSLERRLRGRGYTVAVVAGES